MADVGRPWSQYVGGALILIPAVWAGMLVGVSFIATPVKFTAPTLDYAAALDVGRVTFSLFNKVEWGLGAAFAVIVVLSRRPIWVWALLAVLLTSLAGQSAWLLPELNGRVAAVIAGAPLPASNHHTIYAVLEAVKFACLIALFVGATRRVQSNR